MLPRSREIQSQRPNGFVTKRFPKNGYIGRVWTAARCCVPHCWLVDTIRSLCEWQRHWKGAWKAINDFKTGRAHQTVI